MDIKQQIKQAYSERRKAFDFICAAKVSLDAIGKPYTRKDLFNEALEIRELTRCEWESNVHKIPNQEDSFQLYEVQG